MIKKILLFVEYLLGRIFILSLFNLNSKKIYNEHYLLETLKSKKSVIICCWHGRLLFPIFYFKNRGYLALASLHGDGEIISRVGESIGWKMIRGSSTRGGKEAFKKMVKALQGESMVVGITPDGPKGPERKVKTGAVKVATRTDTVILPVSGQASRRWEIKNWDTFVVPKPFGKTCLFLGDPIYVDSNSSIKEVNSKLENSLTTVMKKADELTRR